MNLVAKPLEENCLKDRLRIRYVNEWSISQSALCLYKYLFK
jgi:hypothetical protein